MKADNNVSTPSPSAAPAMPRGQELSAEANEEQLLYAKILAWGMYLGLGILLVTFGLYLTGIVAPAVPIDEVSNYWTLSAHDYLEVINNEFLHRDHVVDWMGVDALCWTWVTI